MTGSWIWWRDVRPPHGVLVRFRHDATGEEWTGYRCDLNPAMNAAYLLWKLTGIERERITLDWRSMT